MTSLTLKGWLEFIMTSLLRLSGLLRCWLESVRPLRNVVGPKRCLMIELEFMKRVCYVDGCIEASVREAISL